MALVRFYVWQCPMCPFTVTLAEGLAHDRASVERVEALIESHTEEHAGELVRECEQLLT